LRQFLFDYYDILTKSFEIFAFIVGVFVYKKYKNTHVKYFIWFLAWVVIVEIVGAYPSYFKNLRLFHLIEGTLVEKNYWWYTLFWASAATVFYPWFLSRKYESLLLKRIIKACIHLYLLVLLFMVIPDYRNIFEIRPTYITILNVAIILISSVFYLFELLNSEKIINSFQSVYFYVAVILFLWWLITTPLNFFEVYSTDSDWDFVAIKWTIKLIANIFMYLGFAFALIKSKPE